MSGQTGGIAAAVTPKLLQGESSASGACSPASSETSLAACIHRALGAFSRPFKGSKRRFQLGVLLPNRRGTLCSKNPFKFLSKSSHFISFHLISWLMSCHFSLVLQAFRLRMRSLAFASRRAWRISVTVVRMRAGPGVRAFRRAFRRAPLKCSEKRG